MTVRQLPTYIYIYVSIHHHQHVMNDKMPGHPFQGDTTSPSLSRSINDLFHVVVFLGSWGLKYRLTMEG